MKKSFFNILLIVILFQWCFPFACSWYSKQSLKDKMYNGVITAIYKNEQARMIYYFHIKTEKEELDIDAEDWRSCKSCKHGIFQYASIGDTIIKNKGDLFVTLKRKDGTQLLFPFRDDVVFVLP